MQRAEMLDPQTLQPPPAPRAELSGAPLPPMRCASLWEALTRAPERATRPWLHFDGQSVTRAEVARSALSWAHAIATVSQCEQSQRVGVLLPNGADFVSAFFAAQALGAAAVPLAWPVVDADPERVAASLEPLLQKARLSALVTTPSMARAQWRVPVVTSSGARSGLAAARPALASAAAFVQFTSGSTGTPRGAVISQRAALHSARAMSVALSLGEADVGVSWLPFFHDMGLVGVLLTSLWAGFPVHVLRPGDFLLRPRRWLELISSSRATLTVGPNFAFDLLVRRVAPEGLDLSSLRCVLSGSEPVHRATLEAFAERFSSAGLSRDALLPVYGLAEATLGVAFSRAGTQRDDVKVGGRAVPSVGPVLPELELRVVDAFGAVRREGEEGLLSVRGPTLMSGYFEDAAATEATLRDGWLLTGDLGLVRDGALYVTGREKELVIQQGRKFHPYDIERVVAKLVDATPNGVAAVSRLDAASRERLVVVVELRRLSAAVDPQHVRGELLRELGVRADEVQFVPAGTLPRTTSGKVKRRQLAATREVPRVLVLGAGGFLGINAVRALLDARITPRCGRRPRGNVLALRPLHVPLAETNFDDPASLLAAMHDIDVVVHTAAHYPRFSLEPHRTLQRGHDELSAVLDAAVRSGVKRLVFVSSTATIAPRADGSASTEADTFAQRPAHGTYHALKWELETQALAERRLEVVVANPAACLGPFDWKVGTSSLLLAAARGAGVPCPRGRVSTVDARDVAAALTGLTLEPEPPRRLILSGETHDAQQLLEAVARRFSAPPPPPALSTEDARALADAQELEAHRTNRRAALPRELVDLIVHAPPLDASLARTRGLRFRPLSETLDAWEAWARGMGLLPTHDVKDDA